MMEHKAGLKVAFDNAGERLLAAEEEGTETPQNSTENMWLPRLGLL